MIRREGLWVARMSCGEDAAAAGVRNMGPYNACFGISSSISGGCGREDHEERDLEHQGSQIVAQKIAILQWV